jgi:predicted RNase H-like HicB family nuclease
MSRTQLARTYKVIFDYEVDPDPAKGSAWIVSIPEVQSCHTYGRSLAEARRNIREALAVCLDDEAREAIAEAAIFDETIRMPRSLREAVQRASKARQQAAKQRAAEVAAARAVTETLSLRDAGELLGLSAEGVRKLLKTG